MSRISVGIIIISSSLFAQRGPDPGMRGIRGPRFLVTAQNGVAVIALPRDLPLGVTTYRLPDTGVKVTLRLLPCPGAGPGRLTWLGPGELHYAPAPAVKAVRRLPEGAGLRMVGAGLVEAGLPAVPWTAFGPVGPRKEWKIPYPKNLVGTGLAAQLLVTWADGIGLYTDIQGIELK